MAKINVTFKQFVAGIKRKAAVLRAHGLLDDRSSLNKSSYKPAKAKRKPVDNDTDMILPPVILDKEAD